MSEPIHRLTAVQFAMLVDAAVLDRRIDALHVHHTRGIRQRDFRGLATLEAQRAHQVDTFGWPDLAQHLTIDPLGGVWTGRNWNVPPASAAGHNGTAAAGPFMIVLAGDFDQDRDRLSGVQRETLIDVLAGWCRHARLEPATSIVFHRDLTARTTCPGSTVDKPAVVGAVQEALAGLERSSVPRAESLFPVQHLAGFSVTLSSHAAGLPAAEVPEHEAAVQRVERQVREVLRQRQAGRLRPAKPIGIRDASEWADLRPHVVNLSRGELSEAGEFSTTTADLDAILDGIRAYAAATASPRVLLYAHGGLVEERGALEYARTIRSWWLDHGVYPVFFVWESGLLEILRQYIIGPRAWTDLTDTAIEIAARGPGSVIWSGMKESARRASAEDLGSGYSGGARQFADGLAALVADAAPASITLHAIGHSAGAIFHSHLLPALIAHGLTVQTVSLLAPAVRVDLFKEKLLPHVEHRRVPRLTMFTMEEDAERQDDCWRIYRKSLLYLVSRSFEGVLRRPILGLHESIRKDSDMRALFGLAEDGRLTGGAAPAALQLSRAPGSDPNPLTRALRHGAFDNDPYTMSAALRRILDVDDATGLGLADFPWPPAEDRAFERPVPAFGAPPPGGPSAEPAAGLEAPGIQTGRPGRRTALCVGIDAYADRPLQGCVNDARAWGAALRRLDFDVQYLLDRRATRASMLDGLRDLVTSASPGDVIVFQYAGHGTQLKDVSGDETDPFDEAIVPVDYAAGAFLIDDDLAAVLERLPAGAMLTMFMDCCHSGTISRFAPALRPVETATERVRYLPVDPALELRHEEFSARVRGAGTRARERALPGVIQFAACRDDEYAWESDGHGDFTTAAARLLEEAAARGDTNEAFIRGVAREVAVRNRQHPSLLPPAPGFSRRTLLAPAEPARDAVSTGGREAELAYHVAALARLLHGGGAA
ncbi:MAG TPA: caspase family protein [Vicinamibacterales bacterium]|nr:caspase family protein [Vicinamibacterales bacterium]